MSGLFDQDTLARHRTRAEQVKALLPCAEIAARLCDLVPLDPRPEADGMVRFACPFSGCWSGRGSLLASADGPGWRCTCEDRTQDDRRGDSIKLLQLVKGLGFTSALLLIEDEATRSADPDQGVLL
jgi:hypothetical protein